MYKYLQTFSVSGRLDFPLDMLRYDHCWPSSSDDVVTMAPDFPRQSALGGDVAISVTHIKTVQVSRHVESPKHQPTVDRWASFGWTVNTATIRTIKL